LPVAEALDGQGKFFAAIAKPERGLEILPRLPVTGSLGKMGDP
jgi:hypothetical protein